jgi:hypothetical protein
LRVFVEGYLWDQMAGRLKAALGFFYRKCIDIQKRFLGKLENRRGKLEVLQMKWDKTIFRLLNRACEARDEGMKQIIS